MRIGIQISSDYLKQRTGVEEYIFQLLKHFPMIDDYKNHQIFIYSRDTLKWPFKWGWTQFRLSWEMKKNPPDVLFVPAHTFPLIYPVLKYKCGVHPKLVITIQGLEFEKLPKLYSYWKRKFLRFLTRRNIKKADKIIVPSENTRKDLIQFYPDALKGVGAGKIFIVHHGVCDPDNIPESNDLGEYLLYLGRSDRRKNIKGLIRAFDILIHKYQIPHKLIFAGPNIGYYIPRDLKDKICFVGYVDENKKWDLLRNADIFVFPSFYEGFGIPVIEAQRVGTPVVCSNTSSLPEIVGNSALLFNPYHPHDIAEAIYKIIKNPDLKVELIKRGFENVKRFSWLKSAKETFKVITS